MEHGAWEGRALRNDPVGHFSEGASLQGRQRAWSKGQRARGKGHGAREDPPNGGDESREAGEHGARGMEQVARGTGYRARRISQQRIGEDGEEW
jgi:hypothetical protein